MKNKAFDKSKYQNWIDPNAVTEYERNAKIHTEKQIDNIANSIKRFGWQQDVVITSDNVLVIGHGRRLAALKLGCMMPYHVIDKTADELTEKDIRELRIADNQTNAETGMDFSVLDVEIGDLDFDGFDFGIDVFNDETEDNNANENYDGYNDEGYMEEQEPLSKEELEAYSASADYLLLKRRVIITFMPEQEEEIKRMLGITDEKIRVVYDINELICENEE